MDFTNSFLILLSSVNSIGFLLFLSVKNKLALEAINIDTIFIQFFLQAICKGVSLLLFIILISISLKYNNKILTIET